MSVCTMTKISRIFYVQNKNAVILYFINKITALYSYSLKEHFKKLIDRCQLKNVWIDFSQCSYMDSTTIGSVIQLHNLLREKEGKLHLCNLSKSILKMFKSSHLDHFLNIEEDSQNLQMDDDVLRRIPIKSEQDVTDEFILDTHHDLVKIVPELKSDFNNLFSVLEDKIKRKNSNN